MKSSEERRNDPDIRQTVTESLDAQKEAIEQARKLLVEAEQIIHDVPYFNEADFIYREAAARVRSALTSLLRSQQNQYTTETYVGNLAAGRFGEVIQEEQTR